MMKKYFVTLFILTVIFSLLTSCGKSNDETLSANDLNENKMTFDNYGREVSLSQTPTKVLTLGPNCTELFVALGLEDYVIGKSLSNHSRGPLPEFAEAVNKIPELNYAEATREAILTSGADFVYAIEWEVSDVGLNIKEAEDYGMGVYINSANTVDEEYKEISDIGKIFGVEDRANELIEDQKARISAVNDKVKDLEPVSVLVYDSGHDGVFTCTGSNFETRLIELAGGENIFSDITESEWTTVSYEDILLRNPDVIIIHDYDSPSAEEKIAEIKANPGLSQLQCVKNNRFCIIDLESVIPGDRMAMTVEKFAKDFHGDAFSN